MASLKDYKVPEGVHTIPPNTEQFNDLLLQDTISPEKEKNSQGFSGFSEEEIAEAKRRGEDLRSLGLTKPQLPSKECDDAKVKEGPRIGDGSSSRIKIFLVNEYPSDGLSASKLPKSRGVMARYFHHLLQVCNIKGIF